MADDTLVDTTADDDTIDAPATDAADQVESKAPADKTEPAPKADPADKKPAPQRAKTIIGGDEDGEEADDEPAAKATGWPDDWREQVANHIAAGDKKVYDKELKRLQRIADPAGVYGMYRELDNRLNGGGLLKVPGKDAKPEEIAAFHKALGVPEKPEDLVAAVQLENGAVIGEADKPLVSGFAAEMLKAGSTPAHMSAALNWYYRHQEEQAAALDEADDDFRRSSEQALRDEWGPAFKRRTNALASIFAAAPGGTDVKNEGSLFARLLGGRTADGKIIGNDPDILRWLDGLRTEINPAATLVEDGNQSGVSIDDEILKIQKIMREDRPLYNKSYANRYQELLAARDKIRARG